MGKKNKTSKNSATTTTTTDNTKEEINGSTDLTDSNTNSATSSITENSSNTIEPQFSNENGEEFNPFKSLTDKQIDIFNKLKENIWSEESIIKPLITGVEGEKEKQWLEQGGDMLVLRYLRARDYDLNLSLNLLKGTLEWRKQYKPYEITAQELSYEASTGKQYVFGKSHGRSVIYLRPVRENTKNHERQIKLLVYNIERAISLMELEKGHEQIVLLIDFNGYSIMNSPPMSVAKQTLQILSDHYPERLGNAFLVDTPFIFNIFWSAISPFINKITYKKIVFANGEKQKKKVFTQYFEPHQLEKEFTGAADHQFNSHVFWKNEIIKNRTELLLPPLSDDEILEILNTKD